MLSPVVLIGCSGTPAETGWSFHRLADVSLVPEGPDGLVRAAQVKSSLDGTSATPTITNVVLSSSHKANMTLENKSHFTSQWARRGEHEPVIELSKFSEDAGVSLGTEGIADSSGLPTMQLVFIRPNVCIVMNQTNLVVYSVDAISKTPQK
jgi:hypothetical protein